MTISATVGRIGSNLLAMVRTRLELAALELRTAPFHAAIGCAFEEGPLGAFIRTDGMKATSVPGVFAVGDLRAGSTKRVAAAAGEGAAVVAQVHRYLAEQQQVDEATG